MELNTHDIFAAIAGGGAAILAAAYSLKRYLRAWGEEDAQKSVTSLLRGEVLRLSEQNKLIATELNRLQAELIALNRELQVLSKENSRLGEEVSDLNIQVDRLHKILDVNNIQIR